jgi:hypothetical protein
MMLDESGRVGRIVKGDEKGRYVKIIDDSSSTGGFLILTSDDVEFRVGHDCWVESRVALEQYFDESDWLIDWIG